MKRNIVQRYFIREVYEKSPKYRIFLTIILYFLQSFSNILDTHEVSKNFPCIQLGKRWTLKEKRLCPDSVSLSLSLKPSITKALQLKRLENRTPEPNQFVVVSQSANPEENIMKPKEWSPACAGPSITLKI